MTSGTIVGVVESNQDPEKMHRVKVKLPVDGGFSSTWCRLCSPNGGADRGLVILPEVGAEVALLVSTATSTPYVIGGVYNGADDRPEAYHNDDGGDHRRVLWTRGDHMLVFDDTPGAESVGFGAGAASRLQVTSGPVHHVLDAAKKEISERCEGSSVSIARGRYSLRCKTLTIEADRILLDAGATISLKASTVRVESGGTARAASPDTHVKTGAMAPPPRSAPAAAPASHPPRRS